MDHLSIFGLQDLPQGLGVGAIPLAGDDDRLNFRVGLKGGVDAFDPGADGAGEARTLRGQDPGQGLGRGDEQVVQVHRGQARGQDHFHRNGGGQADAGPRGVWS